MPVALFFTTLIILRLMFSNEPKYKSGRDDITKAINKAEKTWAEKCDRIAGREPKK